MTLGKANYLVTLERKEEPLPRNQFVVPFFSSSGPDSIRSTLGMYPNLFDVIAIVPIPETKINL